MRSLVSAGSIFGVVSVIACSPPELQEGHFGCTQDSQCPNKWECHSDQRCYPHGSVDDGDSGQLTVDAGEQSSDGGIHTQADGGSLEEACVALAYQLEELCGTSIVTSDDWENFRLNGCRVWPESEMCGPLLETALECADGATECPVRDCPSFGALVNQCSGH